MKFVLIPLLTIFALPIPAQSERFFFASQAANQTSGSEEIEEALRDFDFTKLRINPNNLRPADIENLEANFLPEVKPYLVAEGKAVRRLTRIAKPIFLTHRAGKSRAVVFESRMPTVFTWKETFVVFSTTAMDILSDDEIAALVAHEVGHLYFAEMLIKARRDDDDRLMRIAELKCDLVALTTLSKLKMNLSKLISAVEKLIEERGRLKIESFQPGSPTLADRQELSKIYIKKTKSL